MNTYNIYLTSNACDSCLWDTIKASSKEEAFDVLKRRISHEEEMDYTITHREDEFFWEYTVE